jgi:hypothetical protein
MTRDVAIACVYFDHKQDDKFNPAYIIRSILQHIVQRKGRVSEKIHRFYSAHENGKDKASLGEATSALDTELSNFSKVFLVLDALDESNKDSRIRVLDELQKLQRNTCVMVTGRPRITSDIESIFQGQGFKTLEIHAQDIDVEQYVQSELKSRPSLGEKVSRDPGLQKLILNTVVPKAQGM